ncbi:MAG: hypothetical protein HY650_00900 [Acidobacteria bacterium]|nr:hypothetical protein [Acidobacteriota bacterium]
MSRNALFCRTGSSSFIQLAAAAVLFAAAAHAQQSSEQRRGRVAAESNAPAIQSADQPKYEEILRNLRWREIGPAIMGGRIDDFAVVESNPAIVFAGTASGGVWKTTNSGTTWDPIFDNEPVSTIGDLAIAGTDPSIVWVGTGEQNNRQSSSWGNGVYRSMDGGRTWAHMGLKESHHIGRIVLHPGNPDTVYVACLGRLWGPNRERGVYKTTDGGRTWKSSLFVNEDTGVVDIAIDHQSPNTLYAAAFQRRRTAFGYNGSGPGSALYKTNDGGFTWKKLTKGLPEGGETGRIGVTVYRSNPNIVYALVEHAKGGVFRSEDKGETWTKMSDTNPRPSYYSQVIIDPNNDQRIWVMGAPMYYSEDGGKTFRTNLVQRIHGDFHALWINPANSDHMILGSDGGIHWSYDRGRTWDFVNTLALGQFYEVGVDMRKPYYICGGLQDNGSWCGPSATPYQQGITNEDWFRVGGGDGFYVEIDPTDFNTVYAESQDGNLFRRDLRTNESRPIRPEPKEGEPRYRFQWNSPIVISSHDARTVYYGGNMLFKSTDRGDSWTKLSGDLTTGIERDKLPIMGKVPDKETRSRHDGVQLYPAMTTLSESPLRPGVIWVGTDDGNLQVTVDDGKTWLNVAGKVPGVSAGTYVSRVVASRHAEGTAYVTFDGHRSNDFKAYVFTTTDYGQTWQSISRGISDQNGTVNVIREHPENPDLLFVGTEYGLFVSFNRGANWQRLKINLPTVPVDDIVIHPRENDLILGTHGRSIWVLDDITPLVHLGREVLDSDLHLFDLRSAIAWRMFGHKGSTGHKMFIAQNPPYGVLINYYLKSPPEQNEKVRIVILDKDGKTVREVEGAKNPGIHRVNWDLRYSAAVELTPAQREAQASGVGFFGGAGRGPTAEPGTYTVKVTVGKHESSKTVVVEEDPRITITPADRAAQRRALTQVYEMAKSADQGRKTIIQVKTSVAGVLEEMRRAGAKVPDDLLKATEDLARRVDDVHGKFVAPPQPQGSAGPPLTYTPPPLPTRINQLMNAIDGYTAAPTMPQMETLTALAQSLAEAMTSLKKLVEEDLPILNKWMNDAGVPHIRADGSTVPAGVPARLN